MNIKKIEKKKEEMFIINKKSSFKDDRIFKARYNTSGKTYINLGKLFLPEHLIGKKIMLKVVVTNE